jgi:CheY-like chemotaxis protein
VQDLLKQEAQPVLDGYVTKPITRSQLFNVLLQVFGLQTALNRRNAKKKISTGSLSLLRGVRILLVEDNEINQIVAVELLRGLGLDVFIAGSGAEALRMMAQADYDAVLMDIQMPDMDGYQTTACIRSDPRFSIEKLPIIAITAHALAGDREKSLQAGLNDHVTKPIDETQLVNVLIRWVKPRQRSEPAAAALPVSVDSALLILPGIDSVSGLQRLGGNRVLFLRLLRLFRADYPGHVQEIRAALGQGDLDLARRLAHTLKGVSGQISASDLSEAARVLEMNIAESDPERMEANLVQVEQQMQIILTSLARLE